MSRFRALRVLLVPAIFGLILLTMAIVSRSGKFARENPGNPINSAMREAMNMMVLDPADEAAVSLRYPTAKITSTGLRYIINQPGAEAPKPERGQSVVVDYRGMFMDGTTFDDSFKRGKPFIFEVGLARVIPGWDEGVRDMTIGEKRTLIIPYWLGYGANGIQGHIPKKATLVFEVELLEIL
jgi:FKBP-type peptidyl-prolyl cis-trans isomerase